MSDVRNQSQNGLDVIEASSEQVADAFEEATRKIIDAVINVEQTINSTSAVSAIHKGLISLGASANSIAERIRTRPGELQSAAESGTAIYEQFGKLIGDAKKYGEAATELQGTAGEVKKAADWIGNNYPSGGDGSGNTAVGRVCDF